MSSPRRATAVGFCLDVDGTLHRSGSVFVETLAHLGFCGELSLDADERRHRRDVIGPVVEYDAGPAARRRWVRVLRGLDALALAGGHPLAEAALSGLDRLRVAAPDDRRDAPRRRAQRADGDGGLDYRTMQRRALDAYGRLIAGRRSEDVERAARAVVGRHVETSPGVETALERLRAAGASVCLVTDAPEHAARAYARELPVPVGSVAGTRYTVDDGRYTGEYAPVDKGAAARRFRRTGGWERLVAAGDAVVDLAMGSAADLFLAVAGEGGLPAALDAPAGPDPPSPCSVVRVGPDRSVGAALTDALETVTDRPG